MLKIMFFPNGNTAVFKNGVQVPAYQDSWLLVFMQLLAATGEDITKAKIVMPDGRLARIVETDGKLNWEIDDD